MFVEDSWDEDSDTEEKKVERLWVVIIGIA